MTRTAQHRPGARLTVHPTLKAAEHERACHQVHADERKWGFDYTVAELLEVSS